MKQETRPAREGIPALRGQGEVNTETTQEAATRYRQKSADVEARQLIDDLRNHTAIAAWVESGGGQAGIPFAEPCLYVETVDGQKRADIGDWIVRFPAGTFQVVPPDKFDAAFEPVIPSVETLAARAVRDAEQVEATAAILNRRYPSARPEQLDATISDLQAIARTWRRQAAQVEAADRAAEAEATP